MIVTFVIALKVIIGVVYLRWWFATCTCVPWQCFDQYTHAHSCWPGMTPYLYIQRCMHTCNLYYFTWAETFSELSSPDEMGAIRWVRTVAYIRAVFRRSCRRSRWNAWCITKVGEEKEEKEEQEKEEEEEVNCCQKGGGGGNWGTTYWQHSPVPSSSDPQTLSFS